jgi:hypothetical protein
MSDLISRQAAIELIERMKSYHQDADDIAEMIANMPSAQPIDVQEAYYRGMIDGIKECTAKLKKRNESVGEQIYKEFHTS